MCVADLHWLDRPRRPRANRSHAIGCRKPRWRVAYAGVALDTPASPRGPVDDGRAGKQRNPGARQRGEELRAGDELTEAVGLLYEFCFKPEKLGVAKLDYEPRASCHCKEPGCAALWIASKSGTVMRVELPTGHGGKVKQSEDRGDREVRAIHHVHDGGPFGEPQQRLLLVGRDDGMLEIVRDRDWGHPRQGVHLDTWYARCRKTVLSVLDSLPCDERVSERYTVDITAIALVPRSGCPAVADLLVATRYPWLYVIAVADGRMTLERRVHMPGWIQWILAPQPGGDHITCVSRGGDIVRFTRDDLHQGGTGRRKKLSLMPTAALAFDRGSLLLGAASGLFLLHDGRAEASAVPVTQSPVLCLARATVDSDDGPQDYVTMGLENRRLHVIHTDLLCAVARGDSRPVERGHNFVIDMPEAVLELQTVRPDGAVSNAYVLAGLRDHSLRLFRVISQQTLRNQVRRLWHTYLNGLRRPGSSHVDATLDVVELGTPVDCDPRAWAFLIVDEILPQLCKTTSLGVRQRERLVGLACEIAGRTDRRGLYRLSAVMDHLTDNQVYALIRLSRAVLGRVPHGDERRWRHFIDFHLHMLHALAGDPRKTRKPGVPGKPGKLDRADHARLVSWTRFVRKYTLLGHTFTGKQFGLRDLVSKNFRTHKYLDALIYQTLLAQRCHDLRWAAWIDEEVAELHVVNCRTLPGDESSYPLVVVVTVRGGIVFLDGTSGHKIDVQDDSVRGTDGLGVPTSSTPFSAARQRRHVRTLASTVTSHGTRVQIVLSCTAPNGRRSLRVVDARWHKDPSQDPSRWQTSRGGRRRNSPVVRDSPVVIEGIVSVNDPPHVYAVQPLPGRRDHFLVGLDTQPPVGLLRRGDAGWMVEHVEDAAAARGSGAHGGAAAGTVPTRALAVLPEGSHYLAVAGDDDGVVHTISFERDAPTSEWRIECRDRVASGVTSIVLEPHDEVVGGAQPSGKLSCYLGTTSGDTFALEILRSTRPRGVAHEPAAHGRVEPLWGDTHDGPVRMLRIWKNTPLYKHNAVLVAATEKGRLCVYNHAERRTATRRSDPPRRVPPRREGSASVGPERAVSASFNYVFRGMRFERITLPERLRALILIEAGNDIIAATPGGRLYRAELVYLRDSGTRGDPDAGPLDEPAGPVADGERLPDTLWPRLHHLFAAHDRTRIDRDPARRGEPQLELFDLVRLDGGALSNYVLHRRLQCHDRWTEIEPHDLRTVAHELLDPLDPATSEHGDRIKVVVKTLCRAFLFHEPRRLANLILEEPGWLCKHHAQTLEMCQFVAEYLRDELAYSRRLRIAAIKELLRVAVLWHMAQPAQGDRARDAVRLALDACLRDDDRIVRFETLRALSVMLGNVEEMASLADKRRTGLLDAVFPEGLHSLTWLLELICDSLQRIPGDHRNVMLVGSAWYYIQPLLPLFRIFPDHTLTLCDYLIRAGLGLRALAACHQALGHRGADVARSRIENLYLLPVLRSQDAGDYIERHDAKEGRGHADLREALCLDQVQRRSLDPARDWREHRWYALDDAAFAERRLQLLDELAGMWKVQDREQIAQIAKCSPWPVPGGDVTAPALRKVPLGQLAWIVNQLIAVAVRLTEPATEVLGLESLAELGKRHGSGVEGQSELTAPSRLIVAGIVGVWRNAWEPPRLEPGRKIGGYVLGEALRLDTVFRTREPGGGPARVIKVVPGDRKSKAVAERFLRGAEFSKLLGETPRGSKYVVPVTAIHPEPPYVAYVMPEYVPLEHYLRTGTSPMETDPLRSVELVAWQIGHALGAAHARGRYHGNVTPSNILIERCEGLPVFRLADFDLAHPGGPARPAAIVPGALSEKAGVPREPTNPVGQRQWDDIAALSVILFRMLTGKQIPLDQPLDHEDHLRKLHELARSKQLAGRKRVLRVVETLRQVLRPEAGALDIKKFLTSLRDPPVAILFLAANPKGTAPLRLRTEYSRIEARMGESRRRSMYRLEPQFGVKAEDLQRVIGDADPRIVHFSGHGMPDGRLVFEHEDGRSAPLSVQAIADVFRRLSRSPRKVRCVVLSACYSDALARAIAQYIPVVIGINQWISDDDAIAFAAEFYRALGAGAYARGAYEGGCTQIGIAREIREGSSSDRDIESSRPPAEDTRPRVVMHASKSGERRRFVQPDQVFEEEDHPDADPG